MMPSLKLLRVTLAGLNPKDLDILWSDLVDWCYAHQLDAGGPPESMVICASPCRGRRLPWAALRAYLSKRAGEASFTIQPLESEDMLISPELRTAYLEAICQAIRMRGEQVVEFADALEVLTHARAT
jgi:hypothetical protein